MRIRYSKTYFQRPRRISQELYYSLKKEIQQNPDFDIDTSPSTMSERFKSEFKFLKYSFIYLVFFIIILTNFYNDGHDKKDDPFRVFLTIPAIIAGLGSFVTIFFLFLTAPSYANYLKDKRSYFESMKFSIIQSADYVAFCNSFYYSYER